MRHTPGVATLESQNQEHPGTCGSVLVSVEGLAYGDWALAEVGARSISAIARALAFGSSFFIEFPFLASLAHNLT